MSNSNQRMAGDAFLNRGYYNQSDEDFTKGIFSGKYGAKDTKADQVDFISKYQGMNRVAQNKYNDEGRKTANRYAGYKGGSLNLEKLQSRIDNTSLNLRDQGTIQEVKTYGDRAAKLSYSPFVFGDETEEVKSNAADIAKEYKKELD